MAKSDWKKCQHDRVICSDCIVIDDAAKRFSDGSKLIAMTNPFLAKAHGWIAVHLADGSCDYNLYPSKAEAIRHQINEFFCAYACLRNYPDGFSPKDAALWLALHRYAYDHGYRLADPDERSIIRPQAREQMITRLIIPEPSRGRIIHRRP